LIVDGSTENEYRQLKNYTGRYPFVNHHYYPIDELNLSLLHNVGIKESNAEYIMRTDCDYVFAKDFIEAARKHMKKNRLVLKQVGILPNMNITMSRIRMWNFPKVHLWGKEGDGACQLTTREWFIKVNGYDERMIHYGVMDNDLNVRAQKDGLKPFWIEESQILHMWHRVTWDKEQSKRDQFAKNIRKSHQRLADHVRRAKENGKRVAGYGGVDRVRVDRARFRYQDERPYTPL